MSVSLIPLTGISIMVVKLGVIGLSPGNGHPYSWSAIINGYDPVFMKDCGFPVIPEYLAKHSFPKDSISNAEVTHIWTEDLNLSKHIAKAANISSVTEKLTDMIGAVDAILLARDDYENHAIYALPFLNAGIPIYIDKPLACSVEGARELFSHQKYNGQIFTGSALKYAYEMQLSLKELDKIGKIHFIKAVVPKDWRKYSIHVIDPIVQLPIDKGSILWSAASKAGCINNLTVGYSSNMVVSIDSVGDVLAPIKISVYGAKGHRDLVFLDTFSAFKSALQLFVNNVSSKKYAEITESVLESVSLIELGVLDDC